MPFAGVASKKKGNPWTKLECDRHVLGKDIYQDMSTETNKYSAQCRAIKQDDKWFDDMLNEIRAHFALCVLMSQMMKKKVRDYWG